jgi:hypothetical protein
MRRFLLSIPMLVALAGPALADPIEGFWRVPNPGPMAYWVYIEPWGDIYAGTLVQRKRALTPSLRLFPELEGEPGDLMPVFARITPAKGLGTYTANIWTGHSFADIKMQLKGDTLSHMGCGDPTPACAPQKWDRDD